MFSTNCFASPLSAAVCSASASLFSIPHRNSGTDIKSSFLFLPSPTVDQSNPINPGTFNQPFGMVIRAGNEEEWDEYDVEDDATEPVNSRTDELIRAAMERAARKSTTRPTRPLAPRLNPTMYTHPNYHPLNG